MTTLLPQPTMLLHGVSLIAHSGLAARFMLLPGVTLLVICVALTIREIQQNRR